MPSGAGGGAGGAHCEFLRRANLQGETGVRRKEGKNKQATETNPASLEGSISSVSPRSWWRTQLGAWGGGACTGRSAGRGRGPGLAAHRARPGDPRFHAALAGSGGAGLLLGAAGEGGWLERATAAR